MCHYLNFTGKLRLREGKSPSRQRLEAGRKSRIPRSPFCWRGETVERWNLWGMCLVHCSEGSKAGYISVRKKKQTEMQTDSPLKMTSWKRDLTCCIGSYFKEKRQHFTVLMQGAPSSMNELLLSPVIMLWIGVTQPVCNPWQLPPKLLHAAMLWHLHRPHLQGDKEM